MNMFSRVEQWREMNDRRHRNGHILELDGSDWRCIHCRHWFDAAVDAEAFWCGDPCECGWA